ncbi:Flagellar basal body-associated protein FliL [Syntrophus gentianae]|uniref:Flagellar protein FliL n=1 Tax=Syntrophus gentianae TaxID=43775 RepID=A0A1H7XP79_9BACT|nr:flagellar basal body-associated FliL family protein [Syntrophus gentianae]SEM35495.1 Flagellar basal body-associated protein FliL [Syntrophus gentianae]
MKQKVQIDVLDVSLFDRDSDSEEKDSPGESSSLDPLDHQKNGNRWWKSKKTLLASCLAFFSASSIIIAFFILEFHQTKPKGNTVKKVPSPIYRNQQRFASLQDFVINFKDHNGKDRFCSCSLTLEAGPNDLPASEKDVIDLRKVLYKIFQQKKINELLVIRDKKALKDEISFEVQQQLGRKFLYKIFFTKFVIL